MGGPNHHKNRRTISINGHVYAAAKARCKEQGVSLSDLAEHLLSDITNAPPGTALPISLVGDKTAITTEAACTCALCTNLITAGVRAHRVPLGKGDADVTICVPCNEEHPRLGRYGFGEGAKDAQNEPTQNLIARGAKKAART